MTNELTADITPVRSTRPVASFVAGAVTAAVGLVAAALAAVIFAASSSNAPYRSLLAEQNSIWMITGSIVYLGVLAALIGAYLVLRALRPTLRRALLVPVLVVAGSLVVLTIGLSMGSTIERFTSGASTGLFDLEVWDIVAASLQLNNVAVVLGVFGILVAVVWFIAGAIRAGARKVASQ